MRYSIFVLLFLVVLCSGMKAQHLQAGFSKQEYINAMKVSAQFGDSAYAASVPVPAGYRMAYNSPVTGLDNKWQLWATPENIPVISIRGTTVNEISWTANFYAAMVPAEGSLHLSNSTLFHYKLASHPQAAVHVGWLIATAFLVKDMLPKIDSCYKAGRRDMLVIGHSQGGAIAYLLTAYFYQLQKQGLLPPDIRFKTYCSAAPKPGNIYFAYEYEAMTAGGWAYNVVNAADWVPQTPLTVQTLSDFAAVTPFVSAKSFIKKQGFFKRLALNYAYGRLTAPANKAAKNYRKYLGTYIAKSVKKHLKEFVEPAYFPSNDYQRAGFTITLLPDTAYYRMFPQVKEKIFANHFHQPYLYLINKMDMDKTAVTAITTSSLDGRWELNYIGGGNATVDGLYPDKKPFINIDGATKKVSGHTGCNSFTSPFTVAGNSIRFSDAMAVTKMFCPGEGEAAFLETLKKVNRYSAENNTLTLLADDIVVMRFLHR